MAIELIVGLILGWLFIAGTVFGISRAVDSAYEDGTYAAACLFFWPFLLPVVVIEGVAKWLENRGDK